MKTKYIQILGDALIPLCGLFFWGWGLYFILLFYFIDMFAGEIVLHLKSNKIIKTQKQKVYSWIKGSFLSFFCSLIVVLVSHFVVFIVVEGINIKEQVLLFWNYEELGIKQGPLLIPLVLITTLMKYKTEFIAPKMYKKVQINQVWRRHNRSLFALIGLAGFSLAIAQFFVLPEYVYVFGLVLSTTVYKIRFN